MGAVDKNEKMKKKEARSLKREEEAPRVLSELEALEGGGSPVDSGSDYEDYSDDGDAEDYFASEEEEEVEPGEETATGSDSDSDESEDGNSEEFKSFESEESDSRDHKGSLKTSDKGKSINDHAQIDDSENEMSESDQRAEESDLSEDEARLLPKKSDAFLATADDSKNSLDGKRKEIWLGLPSKGRMSDETLGLLKDCGLSVKRSSPRRYVAEIPQLCNSQVWFQRPKGIVEELLSGKLDIGIVGFDTISEYGQGNEDLIIVHDALNYGHCRLSLAIPKLGKFEKINSVKELAQMPQWTKENPLKVATGFTYLGHKFMKESGLNHVSFVTGDGALEAFPAMGTADVILDLVSSGTTLRENNLKEIEGGTVLESQAVLVASRKSLLHQEGVLDTTEEILERLEAHLKAVGQVKVTANMRGRSAEEIAKQILSQPLLSGLQHTIIPVIGIRDGKLVADCVIEFDVPKEALDGSKRQLRAIGCSKVSVSESTYIFVGENPRWHQLLSRLGGACSQCSGQVD